MTERQAGLARSVDVERSWVPDREAQLALLPAAIGIPRARS
jgi:hypothetical protein